MKDLVRKLILGQWVMIHLLSTATKGPARLSLSLTVSSAFWKKRVSLCGLVNGENKKKKKTGKMQQDIDSRKSTSDSFKIHTRIWISMDN